jgi:hypothetical protein
MDFSNISALFHYPETLLLCFKNSNVQIRVDGLTRSRSVGQKIHSAYQKTVTTTFLAERVASNIFFQEELDDAIPLTAFLSAV